MSTSFLKLPGELRNRVYEQCFLHQEPLDPWTDCNQRQELAPGPLLANKTVHREASSLFYPQNRLDFTIATSKDVTSFLGTIGRNADYIQHVCIDFPNLRDLEQGNFTLKESRISILVDIQSRCVNLSTLTTSVYSSNARVLQLDALDFPNIITEALKLEDTRFRAISSVQEIIVELYEDGSSCYIRRKMESHGWTVSAIIRTCCQSGVRQVFRRLRR